MLNIRKMQNSDYVPVLEMVNDFYESNAVAHSVPEKIMIKTLNDAISQTKNIVGYTLISDNEIIGFAYITFFYACEMGGECLMIEEIYFKENARGKGYGSEFFKFLFNEYDDKVVRYRLELTEENDDACRLYKSLGFDNLGYKQMVRDL